MKPLPAGWLMFASLVGMLLGILLPFLMLIKLIESTLFLNFLAFTLSVGGLLAGIVSIATYATRYRNRRNE